MDITLFENVECNFSPELLLAMKEIQQSRSNFQMENFVVNQHDTDEMRYKQTVLELQNLYYTIKTVSLQLKKDEIEIKRLRSTGDEIDEIDAQIKELGLEQTRLIGIGTFRELKKLLEIYESFEHKYTNEEIEAGQKEYWNRRLNRQATLEAIGGTSAQASHLDALRQMGAIQMLPDGGIHVVKQEVKQVEKENKKEL